jgi:hypothetical protein
MRALSAQISGQEVRQKSPRETLDILSANLGRIEQ